jgi:phage shock protein PspC (stress-responsive transcriptional regulator)
MEMARSLTRSKTDRILGGVCGGIAKTYGWDPTLVRIGYVLVSILSAAFPGILFYIILWVLIPEEF